MARVHRFGQPGLSGPPSRLSWRGILALAVALAAGTALFILAAGLFLVLLPVFLVLGLLARWQLRRMVERAQQTAAAERRRQQGEVIDATYEVVEIETHEAPPHSAPDSHRRNPWDR